MKTAKLRLSPFGDPGISMEHEFLLVAMMLNDVVGRMEGLMQSCNGPYGALTVDDIERMRKAS